MSEKQIFEASAKYKSPVWRHFGFLKGPDGKKKDDTNVCKICGHEIRYTCKNTPNMALHLRRKHGIEIGVAAQTPKSSSHCQEAFHQSSSAPVFIKAEQQSRGQQTIAEAIAPKLSANSAIAKLITLNITKLLATDLRPFTLVDNKAFKELLHCLEPKYSVPSRTTFSHKEVPVLYSNVSEKLRHELQKAPAVSLTTDGWTSRATTSYITITAHFIDSEWNLQSNVLQTRPIFESHTGFNISEVLKAAVVDWKLERVHGMQPLTSDSAAIMVVDTKEADMNPHIKCFAHIINLAAQQGLKVNDVQLLLGRIRRVVSFFHRSSSVAHQLKLKQELLQIPQHKLICEVKTRWNSAYDMVERYLEQQPAIMAVLTSKQIKKDKDLDTLTAADISSTEQLVVVLKPLKTVTTILCDDKEPTFSVVMPLLTNLMKTSLLTRQIPGCETGERCHAA